MSWITSEMKATRRSDGKVKKRSVFTCWWPQPNTKDEGNIQFLIRNGSDPDKNNWRQLPGFRIGTFDTFEAAERALNQRDGTAPTTEDDSQSTETGESSCIDVQNVLDTDPYVIDSLITAGGNVSQRSKIQKFYCS